MSKNRSNDDLGEHLRSLPELPVPAGLEGRLLAAIPSPAEFARRRRRRRWARLGMAVALAAAAVLLAVLLGNFLGSADRPDDLLPPHEPLRAEVPSPTLGHYRRAGDSDSLPASFEWPVQLAVPTARLVPDDLTD